MVDATKFFDENFVKNLDWQEYLKIPETYMQINQRMACSVFHVKRFDQLELNGKIQPSDYEAELLDGTIITIDFKNYRRGNENPNFICLEQKNDILNGTLGWTFKIKNDYIIFNWTGKKKLCYLCVDGKKLRNWWWKNHKYYNEIKNRPTVDKIKKRTWTSSYSRVPISELPADMIIAWEQFVDLNDFFNLKEAS